jgi:hypothetical protein
MGWTLNLSRKETDMQAQNGHSGTQVCGKMEEKRARRINNPTLSRLLALKNAAEYLCATEWAMRTLAWSEIVPVVRFPSCRKMHFDIVDLDEVIRRNKTTN